MTLLTLAEGNWKGREEEEEEEKEKEGEADGDGVNEGSSADLRPVSRQVRPLFSCDRVGGPAERGADTDGVDITRGEGGGCVAAADLNLFRELAPFPSPTCCLPSALRLRVEKGYPGRSRGDESG